MREKIVLGLLGLVCLFTLSGKECHAEIAGDEAFTNLTWEQVHEDQIQGPTGVVQSICATEDYIICIENTADNATDVDIVSAYYKNDVDENGNPVEQYSLAKRVADTNWEHGNGMTYNPDTHEIYVALYTNMIPENRGSIFVMDPDTLGYKRTIKISDDYNILGISYRQDTDQYVIQTNTEGGYSFKVLDADFHVVEDLGSYADTAKADNFQDLAVNGDYILNFPLTLNTGLGDFLHVYSISRKAMVADPKIDFKFENVSSDEPEALCEIEPGVYLAAVNVTNADGARKLRFYRVELPYYFQVTVTAENGTTVESSKVLRGESFPVSYESNEGYQLSGITVDGEKQSVKGAEDGYTLENIQENHTVEVHFKKIPVVIPNPVAGLSEKLDAVNVPAVSGIVLACCAMMGLGGYYFHIRMERKRKYLRARRRRQQFVPEF